MRARRAVHPAARGDRPEEPSAGRHGALHAGPVPTAARAGARESGARRGGRTGVAHAAGSPAGAAGFGRAAGRVPTRRAGSAARGIRRAALQGGRIRPVEE